MELSKEILLKKDETVHNYEAFLEDFKIHGGVKEIVFTTHEFPLFKEHYATVIYNDDCRMSYYDGNIIKGLLKKIKLNGIESYERGVK